VLVVGGLLLVGAKGYARMREEARAFYQVRIVGESGIPIFLLNPEPLTQDEATEWFIDQMEEHWGSRVYLWRWEPKIGEWVAAR
jgi:hypothetical protein